MSLQLIDRYYNKLDKIIQYGGSDNEQSIRDAFRELLGHYAEKRQLMLISELKVMGTKGSKVQPDGTLKNALRLEYGHWESKDTKDNLDAEIDNKIKKGYPLKNIIFEDSNTSVLIQNNEVIRRINMKDRNDLDSILNSFINFEHEEVLEFSKALDQFVLDLPNIIEALRELIEKEAKGNKIYISARDEFLENCKQEINPEFTINDIREMLIQHILTEEIFNAVFDESHFHMENNIARKLDELIKTFFTGDKRRNTLDSIKHYYNVISSAAKNIVDHHEKQKFLKIIYENFYKSYNPKAADRLGVVYTPNEIVKFMINSTDYLLDMHFGKTLADKGVDILDPATGTGTFICDLIEHLPQKDLAYKYKNEIHANEVAILPYYVANLNIEYTFKQKMGYYSEFPNLCFVDTLDNTSALNYKGKQELLFGLSSENAERIKRQNDKKISVIIGNPPYNANQKNENENNKNREYEEIDRRIKNTFVKESRAQKTKTYDMYSRFFRWAMDRINDNGIIAFITNRSFINSRTFDGFRKIIDENYDYLYIIDTKSDVRDNPKISGTVYNVFGIQTGVAISFLIKSKNKSKTKCEIKYVELDDFLKKEVKLEWLNNNPLKVIDFRNINPDKNNYWINLTDNNWDELLPTLDKTNKLSSLLKNEKVLFRRYSNGTVTNRDEWVYSFEKSSLSKRIKYFIKQYNYSLKKWNEEIVAKRYASQNNKELMKLAKDFIFSSDVKIKWSGRLFRDKLLQNRRCNFDENKITSSHYRPFVKKYIYFDYIPIDIRGQLTDFFNDGRENIVICFNGPNNIHWNCFASKIIIDLGSLHGGSQCIPMFIYEDTGKKSNNITNWGLEQFQNYYKDKKINHEHIFGYVYGVLNNPNYQKKYKLNLKREFPRIPFYEDFWKWSNWGKKLLDLHINYEDVEPYKFTRKDEKLKEKKVVQKEFFPKVKEPETMFQIKPSIKVKLKADKEIGKIFIDEITTLSRIPKLAWEYKFGNRSALEWILEYHKERKPKDPTIAEKFNNYKFADHKEDVIELLRKVCTVSIETMKIVQVMDKEKE